MMIRFQPTRKETSRVLTAAMGVVLLGGASGCTMTERYSSDGVREVSYTFGPVIQDYSSAKPGVLAIRTAGIGILVDDRSVVGGVFRTNHVLLDDSCRVVVLPESNVEMQNITALLAGVPNLCTVEGNMK